MEQLVEILAKLELLAKMNENLFSSPKSVPKDRRPGRLPEGVDDIDMQLRDELLHHPEFANAVYVERINKGVYMIGDLKIAVLKKNEKLRFRTGGGWISFHDLMDEFGIEHHAHGDGDHSHGHLVDLKEVVNHKHSSVDSKEADQDGKPAAEKDHLDVTFSEIDTEHNNAEIKASDQRKRELELFEAEADGFDVEDEESADVSQMTDIKKMDYGIKKKLAEAISNLIKK